MVVGLFPKPFYPCFIRFIDMRKEAATRPSKSLTKKMLIALGIAVVTVVLFLIIRKELASTHGKVTRLNENWNLYESYDYGYTLEFPSDWIHHSRKENGKYYDDFSKLEWIDEHHRYGGLVQAEFTIRVKEANELDLNQWIDKYGPSPVDTPTKQIIKVQSEYTISGEEAVKFIEVDLSIPANHVYMKHKDFIYEFYGEYFDNRNTEDYTLLTDQMLKSFTFT